MKTPSVHTSIVGDAHAYTRSNTPWILSEAGTPTRKLIRYISGGGMRAFGRTVRQEEVRRRQAVFLSCAAVLAGLWLVFLIF